MYSVQAALFYKNNNNFKGYEEYSIESLLSTKLHIGK